MFCHAKRIQQNKEEKVATAVFLITSGSFALADQNGVKGRRIGRNGAHICNRLTGIEGKRGQYLQCLLTSMKQEHPLA